MSKTLSKHSNFAKVFIRSSVFITAMAAFFLFINSAPSTVSADSTTFHVEVPLTLAITSHTPVVSIDASTEGTFYTGSATITSTTNNPTGYRLDMEDKDTDTALENTYNTPSPGSFLDTIESITSNITINSTGSNFTENHWGYAKEDTSTIYRPIPQRGSADTVKTTTGPASSSNAVVTFGTRVTKDLVGGDYTDTVIFSLTANTVERNDLTKLNSMQDLANHPTYCANSLTGTTATLPDERDPSGKQYKVRKLADGNCWMIDNMKIAGLTIEPTKSNVPAGTSFNLPVATVVSASGGPTWANQAKESHVMDATSVVASDSYLYNWYAATAGAQASDSDTTSSLMTAAEGSAAGDICPKGWKLPDNEGNKSFYNLYNIEYPTASDEHPYQSSANMRKPDGIYPGFVYTGYYNFSTGAIVDISYANYWSRTIYDAGSSRFLSLNNSSVSPQVNHRKGVGFAVRCVSSY